MNFKDMSYNEIKEIYVNDPAVRNGTKTAFKHFDAMDPVKALNDIENLKFILLKRLEIKMEKCQFGIMYYVNNADCQRLHSTYYAKESAEKEFERLKKIHPDIRDTGFITELKK